MAIANANFINDEQIFALLEKAQSAPLEEAERILEKAALAGGLTPWEAAVLLQLDNEQLITQIYRIANQIKEAIYGRRLVFFAPLYISDYCVNNCIYCGYRRDNTFSRRKLTVAEIQEEVLTLERMGHKRLALECGEDLVNCPLEYVLEALQAIYDVKAENGSIRRVNVNIAATTVEDYSKLAAAKIGTYILFQETYHRPSYTIAHPCGPKADYDWHTCAMDRAMEGGIDDVGLGVLFGLYNYRYEVLALLFHALHLEEIHGVGPHTISVPRMRPAQGINLATFPYLVSDSDFKKIIAILRLAVPYTGIILSTRERAEFRDELLSVGISQLSAGSCTGVGGYRQEKEQSCPGNSDEKSAEDCIERSPQKSLKESSPKFSGKSPGKSSGKSLEKSTRQFAVEDRRSLEEVVSSVCRSGYIPSFCTACYRSGRTGHNFMELAKSGQIHKVCQPNALLSFQEFLLDYASTTTKLVGEATIARQLELLPNPEVRQGINRKLEQLAQGDRDLYL